MMIEQIVDVRQLLREAQIANTAIEFAQKYRRLDYIDLSPIQQEFIERPEFAVALLAANQFGKSQALAVLIAILALGRYPRNWKGWRQPQLKLERQYSIVIWIVSPTTQVAVSGMQARLLGTHSGPGLGTGTLPLESIVKVNTLHGMSGAVESVEVQRDDGSLALIRFKSVAQGRDALQAETVDVVAIDEMITDDNIFPELLSRISATQGIIRLAATPLKQANKVAEWFKEPGRPERVIIRASRDQATHLNKEQNEAFLKSLTSQSDIETRYYGLDYRGGGLIYTTPFSELQDPLTPDKFGASFKYLIAIDPSHFGRQGTFAAVYLAIDPVANVAHVFDAWEMTGALPEQHVAKILNSEIADAPVAWPHDATQGTATGETIAAIYKRLGLNMLPTHAQFYPDGGYAVEPGIALVDQMMATGRLKIAKHLLEGDFGRYLGMYERDDNGKPIKKYDHMLDALRIGCMSLKHAKALDSERPKRGLYSKPTSSQRAVELYKIKRQEETADPLFSFIWGD